MTRAFFAPGRVNLIGEHTDYSGGLVLPAALELGVRVEGAAADRIALASDRFAPVELDTRGRAEDATGWGRYVVAVAAELGELGRPAVGFTGTVSSDLRIGAGLSSSAALEVAIATALCAVADFPLEPLELALAAQRAEHRAVGVPCGIMDQAASVLGQAGHAMFLDTASLEHRAVPLPPELALVVIDSGVPRRLEESRYGERRGELERALVVLGGRRPAEVTLEEAEAAASAARLEPVLARRLRHVVTENERVRTAVSLLSAPRPDLAALGEVFRAGHESLRRDFEVTTAELDLLVELAYEAGALAARMTGAGFGGSIVALVQPERVSTVVAEVVRDYRKRTALTAVADVTRPGAGARELVA